jgi:hypothetical protein
MDTTALLRIPFGKNADHVVWIKAYEKGYPDCCLLKSKEKCYFCITFDWLQAAKLIK